MALTYLQVNLKSVLSFLLLYLAGLGTMQAQTTLQTFIDSALLKSPALRTNQATAKGNDIETERIKALLTAPKVGAEVSYLMTPVLANQNGNTTLELNPPRSLTDYNGYDLAITNGGLYRAVITLEQPLLNKSRYNAAAEQLKIQNDFLENNNRLTRHDLEKVITDSYLTCLTDIKQISVIKELQGVIQEQQRITTQLAAKGLLKQSDVQLLVIEAEQQDNALFTAKQNYRAHLLDLKLLAGMTDTTTVLIAPVEISKEVNPPAASGFLKKYALDSLNLVAEQHTFEQRYKPQFDFYSSGGLNTVYAPDIPNRFGLQFGLRFIQPIYDGRQRQINDRRIKLLEQATAYNSGYFVEQNKLRKLNLEEQIRSNELKAASLNRQLIQYNDLLKYYGQEIVAGQQSVINYLTVLRSKASIQNQLVLNTAEQQFLINNYNYWNW